MFFGYESKTQMMAANPTIAADLIRVATRRPIQVCTRGKNCTGSIDGRQFRYADGTTDHGTTVCECTAKLNGHTFRWLENPARGPIVQAQRPDWPHEPGGEWTMALTSEGRICWV